MTKDREELSLKVVGIAAKVLSEEGPDALTVRRIAQESGASTQLIYTLFGGKFGLVDGLYKQGFQRMVTFMHQVQDPTDVRKNLENILRGYRQFATEQRPFFTVMFTRPVAEYNPPPESLQEAWKSFGVLVEGVNRCQQQGLLKDRGDATYVARRLWSQIHGVVALEMIGHLWDQAGDKIYEDIIRDLWN